MARPASADRFFCPFNLRERWKQRGKEMSTQQETGINPSIWGSAHVSTSNVISYSLVTSAAMLAFFFTFQVGLISSYPSIKGLNPQSPLFGKIAVTSLCVVAIVFTIWSYKIVALFIRYFQSYLESGAALENRSALEAGIYQEMLTTFRRPDRHLGLFVWTAAFLLSISLLWVCLIVLAWA
jgi:hypothetical protein